MIPSEFLGDVDEFQSQYLWLIIIGSFAGFLMAFGIGANDVANSFGTSVGSASITFRQAVCLAAICETIGALALGAAVTETVRKGIVDVNLFKYNPELLMTGMFAALLAAGVWLIGCSHFGLPVSTTHSIIGALIGIGLGTAPESVQWSKVGLVVLSWLTSPLLSGLLSSIVYVIIRWAIMRRGENGPKYALRFYPVLLFMMFIAISLLGAFKIPLNELKAYRKENGLITLGIALAIAIGLMLITYVLTITWLKKKLAASLKSTYRMSSSRQMGLQSSSTNNGPTSSGQELGESPAAAAAAESPTDESKESSSEGSDTLDERITREDSSSGKIGLENVNVAVAHEESEKTKKKKPNKLSAWLNVRQSLKEGENLEDGIDEKTKMLRARAEIFPRETEIVFNYLQVTSACFCSLAHGSNDTANAIGPLACMISLYTHASVQSKASTPWWLSLLGGITISIGLFLYGYRVLKTVGAKLCKITPSRGFSMEMGASLIIVIGSTLGIPLSTTHCQVGAAMGVGLCETKSIRSIKGVNVGLFGKIVVGWIITLIFTAGLAIMIYTIIAALMFPRIEAHPCGSLSVPLAALAAKSMSGLIPEYSSPATLQTYLAKEFTTLDTNADGLLTLAELEVKTGKDLAKNGLSSFGSSNKMSSQQFSDWRCGGKYLTTMQDGCVPLCADSSYVAQPVECTWVEEKLPEESYRLIAHYQAGVGCQQLK